MSLQEYNITSSKSVLDMAHYINKLIERSSPMGCSTNDCHLISSIGCCE